MEAKSSIFQYFKDLDLPVFIRVDLSDFSAELIGLLSQMNFTELNDTELSNFEKRSASDSNIKIINMVLASPIVGRQISSATESDLFGAESVIPKSGYSVYRYKGEAMVVYSLAAKEWELGCFHNFGQNENILAYRSILTRLLGWALAQSGIVGFWGVPVEEGIVVMRQGESQGESIFVDVYKKRIYSQDGVSNMKGGFTILKLDASLTNRNVNMRSEELLSYLSLNCTYLSYEGLTRGVRQMIQSLSRQCIGLIHPKDSFKPRTDLSL